VRSPSETPFPAYLELSANGRTVFDVQPGRLSFRSLASVTQPGQLDLRKPNHAKRIQNVLEQVDLD
jgi:hypothetical protein